MVLEHTVQCDYNLHAWMCHQVFRYNSVVIWLRFQICCNKCCYIRVWSFKEKIFTNHDKVTNPTDTIKFQYLNFLNILQLKCKPFKIICTNIYLAAAESRYWSKYLKHGAEFRYLAEGRLATDKTDTADNLNQYHRGCPRPE